MPRIEKNGGTGAGTITGTVGNVDNAVPRADGVGGATLQGGPLIVTDAGVASGITFADPAVAQQPATRTYADLSDVAVQAMTVAALPAYATSGGPGVGFTLTATANGAFPVLDGTALVTASLTEAVTSRFLLHNGAVASDNRVFSLIQQGSAGTPWIARAYTGLDTAAKMAGSQLRIQAGQQSAGLSYIFKPVAPPTLGVSAIYWWPTEQEGHSPNEYVELINSDFNWGSVNINGTASNNEAGLVTSFTGTATATMLARAANTTTRRGVLQLSVTTTTANALVAHTGAIFLGANDGFYLEWKGGLPVLSNGTDTFSCFVGFADGNAASPANAVIFSFQPAISTTDWQLTTSSAGTPTNTPTGRTIVAGTDDHIIMRKDPGDPNIYLFLNGAQVGAGVSTNVPTAVPVSLFVNILKSVGNVTARLFESDFLRAYSYTPTRRAA